MMTMTKTSLLLLTIAAAAICATTAWAQEGAADRDPFFSPEKRPAAPATVPASDAWGQRDPFSNPLAGKEPARKERGPETGGRGLTGIIYSKNIRLAIINGETVGVGSSIGDRTLVSIDMRSVTLKHANGSVEEIYLQEFSLRK
jgi:hypothetical protein